MKQTIKYKVIFKVYQNNVEYRSYQDTFTNQRVVKKFCELHTKLYAGMSHSIYITTLEWGN